MVLDCPTWTPGLQAWFRMCRLLWCSWHRWKVLQLKWAFKRICFDQKNSVILLYFVWNNSHSIWVLSFHILKEFFSIKNELLSRLNDEFLSSCMIIKKDIFNDVLTDDTILTFQAMKLSLVVLYMYLKSIDNDLFLEFALCALFFFIFQPLE